MEPRCHHTATTADFLYMQSLVRTGGEDGGLPRSTAAGHGHLFCISSRQDQVSPNQSLHYASNLVRISISAQPMFLFHVCRERRRRRVLAGVEAAVILAASQSAGAPISHRLLQ